MTLQLPDAPKTLADPQERALRSTMLNEAHVTDLAEFVRQMRASKGPGYEVPDFDPLDGGIHAKILFLLEAPGAKAISSGFISRNNPDETAKNFFLLNAQAGIDRSLTATWNAVPWYIGSGTKIRPATRGDVGEADRWLTQLLTLLKQVEIVVFVGKKALHAQHVVVLSRPDVAIASMPHPSPMFVNRSPDNRNEILKVLREVSASLAATLASGSANHQSQRTRQAK